MGLFVCSFVRLFVCWLDGWQCCWLVDRLAECIRLFVPFTGRFFHYSALAMSIPLVAPKELLHFCDAVAI